MLRIISIFFSLSHSERLLSVEAFIELARVRFLVRFGNFSKWQKQHLGTVHVLGDEEAMFLPADTSNEALVKDIGRAIERVARHTPFTANCLPQACAAQIMLKRRNILDGQVFVGGKIKDSDKSLGLHAWIFVGEKCVLGYDVESGLESFKPLLCYRLPN